ncbi:MAG: pseudouridine synthase [Gammaproteobacteria bacterium]
MSRAERAGHAPAPPAPAERLQKALARAGLGSRREIEAWIGAGRVTVNGVPATLGQRVTPADRVSVDDRPVAAGTLFAPPTEVIGLHKPTGVMCTRSDPQGRPTVFELLPEPAGGRWVGIGRLDLMSGGLMLFTTDGELAHRMMHPSYQIDREYAVRVLGELREDQIARLLAGVELEDGTARFESVADAGGEGANRWYRVRIREGRRHEVRRLMQSQGLTVSRLLRVRYGPIELPRSVRSGRWWRLSEAEVAALRSAVRMNAFETATTRPVRLRSADADRGRDAPRRPRRPRSV